MGDTPPPCADNPFREFISWVQGMLTEKEVLLLLTNADKSLRDRLGDEGKAEWFWRRAQQLRGLRERCLQAARRTGFSIDEAARRIRRAYDAAKAVLMLEPDCQLKQMRNNLCEQAEILHQRQAELLDEFILKNTPEEMVVWFDGSERRSFVHPADPSKRMPEGAEQINAQILDLGEQAKHASHRLLAQLGTLHAALEQSAEELDDMASLLAIPDGKAPSDEKGSVLPTLLSASDLATRLGLNPAAVETFLRRHRKIDPFCCEVLDCPQKNKPKYLYHTAKVLPVLHLHYCDA